MHKYKNCVPIPANTTSVLQPLDLEIIQNFKMHYRKLLFHFVLAKIEECASASDVTNSLTILQAIRWAAEAWTKVTSDTIKKCFQRAGILTQNFEVVQPQAYSEEADPFADIDEDTDNLDDTELDELILESENACSVSDLVIA